MMGVTESLTIVPRQVGRDTAGPGFDEPLEDLADLLNASGAADLRTFEEQVRHYTRVSVHVPRLADQTGLPHHLRLTIRDAPLLLIFPLTLPELWDLVDEVVSEVATADQVDFFWSRLS